MIRKAVRKRLAAVVIAALCMMMCCPFMKEQITAKAAEADTVASSSEDGVLNRWTPTSSWEEEEVVERLDNNNIDENGYTYKLTVRGTTYTAELTRIEMTRYRGAREDIVIRVPDRVEKDGVEYVVTRCTFSPSEFNIKIKKKFRFYMGKGIQQVYCGDFLWALVSYVHSANENYISRDGVLFTKDETTLVRFGSERYEPERIYTLPEQVEEIAPSAFAKADVKQVILNEKITELPRGAFEDSYLQKMDLKNVNKIDRYVFMGCRLLKEVKINCRNVEIGEMAFISTGIENLYIPPGAVLDGMCIVDNCQELETVIMGEGSKILAESEVVHGSSNTSVFGKDVKLKTLVFPEGMTEIPKGCLGACCSMRKLYVPDSIETIRSFNTTGKFTLYGRNETAMESYEGNAVFVNLSGHKHTMKEVTFFECDSWGVKGKYCEECGYGCDTELVEYVEENTKEEMPEMLCVPEEKCPDKLELDKVNRDGQGVVYQLDDINGTAKAVDLDDTFDCGFIALPEAVEKNGKTYVLETIGEFALNYICGRVLVSDSVKNIENYALSNSVDIVLGKNVNHIDEKAFCNVRGNIHVPEDNVNFTVSEGTIYTADGKELIQYGGNMSQKELTIPANVEKIYDRAFYAKGNWLETIRVYGNEGKFRDDVFPSDIEIIYMGQTEEVPESPTPEPKETATPTPEPKETATPTPEPEETVKPTPKPEETVRPTPEPEKTVKPTPEPEETATPTPEPEKTVTSFSTELPDLSDTVQRGMRPELNLNAASDSLSKQDKGRKNLSVTGLRVSTKDGRNVTLRWKVNTAAQYYKIYRAGRKNGPYKVIRTLSGNQKNFFVDKNVRPLKKYYYKVSAIRSHEGVLEEGSFSLACSISVSGILTPKIKMKKGYQQKKSYIMIVLKKHQGKYIDIYTSFNGKKYNKLKVISHQIDRYKGRFKIRYTVVKKVIYIKVRTWQGKGKKKRYSNFSNVVKVKV